MSNRTLAIILTVITSLCCGLPGLALLCLGASAAIGTQMPEVMAQQDSSPADIYLGTGIFLCAGLLMMILPVIVGIFSFRMTRKDESFPPSMNSDSYPQ